MRIGLFSLAFASTSFLFIASAQADTTYTSRGSFLANSTGTTSIDFNSLVPAGQDYVSYPAGSGPTVMNVSFSSSALLPDPATPQILFALAPNTLFNTSSEGLLASESPLMTTAPLDLLITLPTGVTAVGFDVGSSSGNPLTVTLSDGTIYVLSSPAQLFSPGFLGFTSNADITSVHLTTPLDYNIAIGNFTFGSAAPEPASLGLLGVGAIGLLVRRRQS